MGKNLDNVREKRVAITLDRERYVKFGFEAFSLLEEKFGTLELAMKALDDGKMATLKVLLWAGLQDDLEEDEVLTEKQVGKMLDLDMLSTVVDTVTAAINLALPQEQPKEAKTPKNARAIPTQV